jgi:DNA-binding MarR family transcriptional regulator
MTIEQEIVNNCVCHKVRVAARSVTNAYDAALRHVRLRATQLAVLAAVGVDGSISITALADELGMDRTTLSRNLGPLKKAGLINVGIEGWHRSRTLEITKKGRSRLTEAFPLWQKAQANLRRKLGVGEFESVSSGLTRLMNVR